MTMIIRSLATYMNKLPHLFSTSENYKLKGYEGRFTICSYRSGLVEVISSDGVISLHKIEDFEELNDEAQSWLRV